MDIVLAAAGPISRSKDYFVYTKPMKSSTQLHDSTDYLILPLSWGYVPKRNRRRGLHAAGQGRMMSVRHRAENGSAGASLETIPG